MLLVLDAKTVNNVMQVVSCVVLQPLKSIPRFNERKYAFSGRAFDLLRLQNLKGNSAEFNSFILFSSHQDNGECRTCGACFVCVKQRHAILTNNEFSLPLCKHDLRLRLK